MIYSLAYDAQTQRWYVMEKSSDFDGWIVLFHCINSAIAQRVMAGMEKAEKEMRLKCKPGDILPWTGGGCL